MSDSDNFNRLIRLLASGGTMVLKRILDKYSAPDSFSNYIYRNQGKVLKLKFYENQRALVVARDIGKMDITLLGKLAFDLFKDKMTLKEKDVINLIKEERDIFMHSHLLQTAKLETPFFERKWQTISTALLEIADEIGDTTFKTSLENFIEETLKSATDIAEIHKILVAWCQSSEELENKIDNLAINVEETKAAQAKKRTPDTKSGPYIDKFQSHYEHTTRVDIQLTRKMEIAKDHLLQDFSVLIYGKPGEGKSTASYSITKDLVDKGIIGLDRCATLFEPSDLKNIHTDDVDLLLIDDIFGKHNADPGKFKDWSNFFSTLQAFISTQKVRVIMTSRMHIYLEYKTRLGGLDLFSRTVELNSVDLSENEKYCILAAQLRAHGRNTADIIIQDCILKSESSSGFPMCAYQFAADEILYLMKENYFSRPYKYYLEQNIRNLDDQSFIALLFVFYKHNALKATDLDITKIDRGSENTLLHIAKLRGIDKPVSVIIKETKQRVNWLKNSYFTTIQKTISFLHDTVYEIVALLHGEEYPSEVITHCTLDFLCQCINTEGDINDGVLVVLEDDFTSLAERLIAEVKDRGNGKRLSIHPFLRNQQFVQELTSLMKASEETFRVFFSTNLSLMYAGIHAFFYHVIAGQSSNDVFFKEALPLFRCSHSSVKTDTCWMCPVKSEALAAACGANREDLYNALLNSGTRVETLCLYKAVENHQINPDFVKRIYDDLKQGNVFIPDQELLQFCLGMSIQHKDTRVYDILRKAGLQLTSELVYYIVRTGEMVMLSSTIEALKRENKWKPDTMSISRAIMYSLVQNNQNILNILEKAGAKLTEFAVYWAIVDYGCDEVSYIIDKLKESDTFDVESRDLAWSLAMAIKKKADDDRIFNKLKQEEIGQDAEEIYKVIEELKSDGRWDTEDYSVAVAYMAACKRPDMTLRKLLENEGVEITPACLNYAVIRYADLVDFVIQSLKATGKFDPSNKYIARAFVWSIECTDKTLYNQFIKEGIQLSMPCLVYAVERFISVSTLEYVIAGLKKEKKWDVDDDSAFEALSSANKRQDRTAFEKLCSEGLSWKPRSLYVAVKCETIYGLKQIVKQLKENKLLNKPHADIEAALSLAMGMLDRRKYSLLKQLGV